MILAMTCTLVACHVRNGDEGSIRVKPTQVAGIYEAKFDKGGSERLELRTDGTYLQDFTSKSRSFHHTGQWRRENDFLDGRQSRLPANEPHIDAGHVPDKGGLAPVTAHVSLCFSAGLAPA